MIPQPEQDGSLSYDTFSYGNISRRYMLIYYLMRTHGIVIQNVLTQKAAKMVVRENDEVVEAFPAKRTDKTFGKSVHVR
ncbi:MAG: hypothetical protein JXC36_09675 [Candidatus Atribacteria bacterium]|nr:hypothetical protein [Candidatus Atribacteria bacterium]